MHVVEKGAGRAHLWLHCMMGRGSNLLPLSMELPGLHLFPDARNHGLSAQDQDMSIEAMADDALKMLNARNIREAVIIGHSMGGKVAMCAVGKQPDRFSKVVILDMAPVDYSQLIPEESFATYQAVTRYTAISLPADLHQREKQS